MSTRKSSSVNTDVALAIACFHVVIVSTTLSHFSWPLRGACFPADYEQPVSGQMVAGRVCLSVHCSFQTAAVLSGTSTQLSVTPCRVTTGPVYSSSAIFIDRSVWSDLSCLILISFWSQTTANLICHIISMTAISSDCQPIK